MSLCESMRDDLVVMKSRPKVFIRWTHTLGHACKCHWCGAEVKTTKGETKRKEQMLKKKS